jgi:P27 family predicted phage terminase small subunit
MVTASNGVSRGQHRRKPLMIDPDAVPKPPRAPRHLGDAGRRWWRSIWSGGGRWLDPASDHLVAELVCVTIDKIAAIEADLDANGRYYMTRSGQELPRPGVADVRALRAQVVSHLSILGFSPSMRAEIGATVQADDALTKFRNRRHDSRSSSKLFLDTNTQAEPPVFE